MSNEKGIVFDIQRYSLHDGKGIRTIVFLKGCPLSCEWCANPESQNLCPELFYLRSRCIMCGLCARVCPEGALKKTEAQISIDLEKCTRCFVCAQECPAMALMQKGREMTAEQAAAEAVRDRVFFEKSGGGVTLSGGEPLYQFGFALALLKCLKAKHIHTVIETTGNVPWKSLEEALPYIDTLYYDVKHVDTQAHHRFVGAGTELILENLQKLAQTDTEVIVRIPVIPGFNDDDLSIAMIAEKLKRTRVNGVDLLKFHQYGAGKYASLGRDYTFRAVSVQEDAAFEKVKAQYRLAGVKLVSY